MSEQPLRQYTDDEVRDRFLEHLAALVQYWLHEDRKPHCEDKMTGLVHSILAAIDGCADLPGFVLAPHPHPDDEQFHRDEDENWWPRAECDYDIAGGLHEQWHDVYRHTTGRP